MEEQDEQQERIFAKIRVRLDAGRVMRTQALMQLQQGYRLRYDIPQRLRYVHLCPTFLCRTRVEASAH